MSEKALAVANKNYSLDKIKDMTEMASVLKNHVVKNKLYTGIKGKNYAHVEGWQFAGGLMGLYPRVVKVENLSNEKEYKWLAEVEIVNNKTNEVVSRGFAICSNKESIKKGFDEYAVLSMAQTRAIGKAYRNLVGWVMKLAGYEATPSEEMTKVGEQHTEPTTESPKGNDYISKLNIGLETLGHKTNSQKAEFVSLTTGTIIKSADWAKLDQGKAQMLIAVLSKKNMEKK